MGVIKMELTLRQQTKKWDVCLWLGYTKDITFTIDWDSGFTFKVAFIFFQFFVDYGDVVEDKLPQTSIDEELLYFANMLYATSKDDNKRINAIIDGIHKLKQ